MGGVADFALKLLINNTMGDARAVELLPWTACTLANDRRTLDNFAAASYAHTLQTIRGRQYIHSQDAPLPVNVDSMQSAALQESFQELK